MSFPGFDSINDKFNELLTNYFNFGNINFKFITKEKLNMEINASHICKSHNLNLDVQSKLNYRNVDLIAKFLSTNMLTLECEVEDFPLKNGGAHFSIINDFSIKYHHALAKYYKCGANYHVGTDLQFITSFTEPIATIHSLFGYDHYFAGAKVCVDTHGGKKHRDTDVSLCVGYSVPDFSFHGAIRQQSAVAAAGIVYEASLFQRVNDNLQAGVNVTWDRNSNNVNVGLCANVDLDESKKTFIKFRTHNYHSLGLAYGFEFIKGVQIALSGEFSKDSVDFGISTSCEMD